MPPIINPSPAAFDEDKLDWVNAHHLREEPLAEVASLAMRFAEGEGLHEPDFDRFERMVDLAREGLSRLSDLPEAISFFFDDRLEVEDGAREWLADAEAKQLASALVRRLNSGAEELDEQEFKAALKDVGREEGVKGKALFMPVRSALTVGVNLWRQLPLQALYYRNAEMQRLVDRTLAGQRFDAAYIHLFRMAPFLAEHPEVVLATGHISREEVDALVSRCDEIGVQRVGIEAQTADVEALCGDLGLDLSGLCIGQVGHVDVGGAGVLSLDAAAHGPAGDLQHLEVLARSPVGNLHQRGLRERRGQEAELHVLLLLFAVLTAVA